MKKTFKFHRQVNRMIEKLNAAEVLIINDAFEYHRDYQKLCMTAYKVLMSGKEVQFLLQSQNVLSWAYEVLQEESRLDDKNEKAFDRVRLNV